MNPGHLAAEPTHVTTCTWTPNPVLFALPPAAWAIRGPSWGPRPLLVVRHCLASRIPSGGLPCGRGPVIAASVWGGVRQPPATAQEPATDLGALSLLPARQETGGFERLQFVFRNPRRTVFLSSRRSVSPAGLLPPAFHTQTCPWMLRLFWKTSGVVARIDEFV